MTPYVAFLRGINLGNRRLKNDELRTHFEQIGLERVATFRASGNVVFADPEGESEAKLQARVEKELEERLGYDVAVFLRSFEELAAVAAMEPFDAEAAKRAEGKLQVLFLPQRPTAKAKKDGLSQAGEEDPMKIVGRELYWLPAVGLSKTKIDLKAIDKALGRGTMRTMGTVEQIVAKHCRE